MALGFTFLGLTLIAIIIWIICRIKKETFPKYPVAFLSYQTLKIKNENDPDVNEMLDKCHELHTADHVTTENEINSSSLQKSENIENNDGNNSNYVNTDFTKEQSETSENKSPEAETSGTINKEIDTNKDDKKVTSINSESETINAATAGPESSDSIDGDKIKEDNKRESSSNLGQKECLSTESNGLKDSQNPNLEKGNNLDSQKVSQDNSCPTNKLENNENSRATEVVQTGKDKGGTDASSKERNEEKVDLVDVNNKDQNLAEEIKSQD